MPLNQCRYLGQKPPRSREGQSGQAEGNLARSGRSRARLSAICLKLNAGVAVHKPEDISLHVTAVEAT